MKRRCVVCGSPCPPGRMTCSEDCHEKFVHEVEEEFGKYKKVVDMATGKAYRVPTREIIERGLKHSDLERYPEWRDEQEFIDRVLQVLRSSAIYLVVVNSGYARTLRDPRDSEHHMLVEQTIAAKEANKPTIVILKTDTNKADRETIFEALEGCDIVGVLECDFELGSESSQRLMSQLKGLLEKIGTRSGKEKE